MSKKTKCLLEVEFEGPDAEKGPQILVDQSNAFVKSFNGGISMKAYGADCSSVKYTLVESTSTPASSDSQNIQLGYFILGLVSSGVLAWLI